MIVADEASLRVAVGLVVTAQVPDDQSLVATGGQQHVRAKKSIRSQIPPESPHPILLAQAPQASLLLKRGGQGRNPAIVALEGSTEDQLLSHFSRSGGRSKSLESEKGEERDWRAGAIRWDSCRQRLRLFRTGTTKERTG